MIFLVYGIILHLQGVSLAWLRMFSAHCCHVMSLESVCLAGCYAFGAHSTCVAALAFQVGLKLHEVHKIRRSEREVHRCILLGRAMTLQYLGP